MASPAAPDDDIDFWIIGWQWAAWRHVSHQLEEREQKDQIFSMERLKLMFLLISTPSGFNTYLA